MSKPATKLQSLSNLKVCLGVALALGAATLMTGCVVRVAPPPPPRVYAPPPPPPPVEVQVSDEVQANEPPPPLPDYEQPPCPEDGYLWTPGYWRWAGNGYFWVPGTWVQPPRVGVLWTPAYWGFVGGVYAFHAGYWGPHVGFYGGVNYGFGYGGVGFAGGRWAGNSFAYNSTVTNVNTTVIHNTYNKTVINNITVNKVSYNGGAGGLAATPTAKERVAAQETHIPPTDLQRQHVQEAVRNPALAAKANGGHPAIAATPRAGAFNGPGVVHAHGTAGAPLAANARRGQGNAMNTAANSAHAAPGAGPHQQANYAKHPGTNAKGGKPAQNKTPPKDRERKPEEGRRN